MKRNLIYIMVCATTLLSSCHIYKAYDRPKDIKTDGVYRSATSDNEAMATDDTTSIGNLPWKEVFKDPYLQTLIEKGLANNVNMQAAILRVDEAKALLLSARLAYVPSLNLNATGTLSSYDGAKPSKIYSVPASASWQVDLFGSLLNASRAAKASLLQTDAYRQAVRSSLIANIANTYYTLLMLDRQVNITEQTSKIWKENVRAMEAMKEAGMTTEAAVLQSQANSHSIEASLADLRRQVRETENAMATMLGEAPHAIERGILENQQLPDNLTVGVPLQLLSNRPDVKQAEMTLANAYYTTNQARAAFYPSITITGSAAWTNSSGMGIVNPGKILLTALGQLSQPIFNHGKLIANLKVTKDEEKIAQMNYQQSILDAGREVSNALYLYNAATDKLTAHNAQAASLTKAVTYTQDLFHSGEATYLEILTAQQSLLGAQLNEVSDSFQRMQAVIDLYNALGGGRD
jgi:multidrug efflux system outer membrane protein